MQRKRCEDGDRDQSKWECWDCWHPLEAGREVWMASHAEPPEETKPADTGISDFRPLRPWQNKHSVGLSHGVVVTGYSSPRDWVLKVLITSLLTFVLTSHRPVPLPPLLFNLGILPLSQTVLLAKGPIGFSTVYSLLHALVSLLI